ncbi:hypothetical protein BD779DRAFT_1442906, partial [Infundibulicybe gibba]
LGGSHSPLSGMLGMDVDQVLEYKIVTPDGQHRTVNTCQSQDPLFAPRGGSGRTSGVVLEVTFCAARRVSLTV